MARYLVQIFVFQWFREVFGTCEMRNKSWVLRPDKSLQIQKRRRIKCNNCGIRERADCTAHYRPTQGGLSWQFEIREITASWSNPINRQRVSLSISVFCGCFSSPVFFPVSFFMTFLYVSTHLRSDADLIQFRTVVSCVQFCIIHLVQILISFQTLQYLIFFSVSLCVCVGKGMSVKEF